MISSKILNLMSHYIALHHISIISNHIISCHITSYQIALHHKISYHITSHHIISYYIIPCGTMEYAFFVSFSHVVPNKQNIMKYKVCATFHDYINRCDFSDFYYSTFGNVRAVVGGSGEPGVCRETDLVVEHDMQTATNSIVWEIGQLKNVHVGVCTCAAGL